MNLWGLAFVGAGVITLAGAALDWDWFMNHPKARLLCALFSRDGARVVYVVLGCAFVAFGTLMAAGVIRPTFAG